MKLPKQSDLHRNVVFKSVANDTVRTLKPSLIPIIMEKGELKKEVKNMLKDLPEDANWDDVMYKIYVRQSIEQGLKDSKAGRIISHEEIKKRYQRAK